jgi:hypothetical protein
VREEEAMAVALAVEVLEDHQEVEHLHVASELMGPVVVAVEEAVPLGQRETQEEEGIGHGNIKRRRG